jgi:hypothetical protein
VIVRSLLVIGLLAAAGAPAAAQRPTPGAPIDLAPFRYARDLPAGRGLTSVTLDAAALAHGRIDDIRIVDEKRRQIPYVVSRADSGIVLVLAAPAATRAATNIDPRLPRDAGRRAWYRVSLPFAGLPDATLILETGARVFRREITVFEGAVLDASYRRVRSESWSNDDPARAAAPLEISLPSRSETDSLFLLVDDGDNDKLPITKATLRLPTYTLRFFRDSGSTLRMVYGRPDLAAPRYDLALIAGQLKDSAAAEVSLGAEQAMNERAGRLARVVFWSLLVGAVLVMLVLIARLVRGDADRGVSSRTPETEPDVIA